MALPIRWLTVFIDLPSAGFETGTDYWRQILGSGLSPFRGERGEFATLLPPGGDPCLRVQKLLIGDAATHLDLHVDLSVGSPQEYYATATELGAHRFNPSNDFNPSEDIDFFYSPGGYRFCIVPWDGESSVPGAVAFASVESRADQLALDIPPEKFEREAAFWAALTGWELRTSSRAEFSFLTPIADSWLTGSWLTDIPVRLLLHRLDEATSDQPETDQPVTEQPVTEQPVTEQPVTEQPVTEQPVTEQPVTEQPVTGHVDFACADVTALVAAHVAAGATVVAEFPNWTVLTDPTGLPYCLTRRNPLTGAL